MPRLNLKDMQDVVTKYRKYFDQLRDCFVQRDQLIENLMWALIQNQHLLVFGPPGTGKTAICDVAFSGITGTNQFHIELSMFMTDDSLYGPYDPKAMREEGVLRHRTEGMLPEANIARLGEFLDANMGVQRSLLGMLHERRFRRGTQQMKVPLLTVFCDTNKSPREHLKQHPYAWAVLDRLLFIDEVNFVNGSDNVGEMVERFQGGRTTRLTHTISIDEIRSLAEVITGQPSLIQDRLITMKYAEAASEYRQLRQQQIRENNWQVVLPIMTDRRICFASQMMEASAVLDGRQIVTFDDMFACSAILGTTEEERVAWHEIVERKKGEYEAAQSQQVDHAQVMGIQGILAQADAINFANGDLERSVGEIKALIQQLDGIIPENDTVVETKERARRRLAEIQDRARQAVLAQYELS